MEVGGTLQMDRCILVESYGTLRCEGPVDLRISCADVFDEWNGCLAGWGHREGNFAADPLLD